MVCLANCNIRSNARTARFRREHLRDYIDLRKVANNNRESIIKCRMIPSPPIPMRGRNQHIVSSPLRFCNTSNCLALFIIHLQISTYTLTIIIVLYYTLSMYIKPNKHNVTWYLFYIVRFEKASFTNKFNRGSATTNGLNGPRKQSYSGVAPETGLERASMYA